MNSLPTNPLPPETTRTNGRLEQQPREASIYNEFTEIEALLIVAGGHVDLGHSDQARTAIRLLAGKVLALKERVCSQRPEQRETLNEYQVHVFDRRNSTEVWSGRVRAVDLNAAEERAIAKANLSQRGNPANFEARRIHEVCANCGQAMKGGAE